MMLIFLSLIVASASVASAQSSFYRRQTITVIAGANAGSTYDLYVRLMARHMGKYIPGNPNFIVQNMGGARSIIGANYVYNVQTGRAVDRSGSAGDLFSPPSETEGN